MKDDTESEARRRCGAAVHRCCADGGDPRVRIARPSVRCCRIFGTPGGDSGPSASDVMGQLADRLANGDPKSVGVVNGLTRLLYDPDLASLWTTVVNAVRALPDARAALGELQRTDLAALGRLRETLFGESMETAAKRLSSQNPALAVIVFGHTHTLGGALVPIRRSATTRTRARGCRSRRSRSSARAASAGISCPSSTARNSRSARRRSSSSIRIVAR